MENTIILASPRSGSNFLSSTLTDASNLFHTYEFFSGGINGNLYCERHFDYIRLYYKNNFKIDYVLHLYKRMFEILTDIKRIEIDERDAINPNHLDLLLDLINHEHQEIWSYSLEKIVKKDKLLLTIFYNHYNFENHFDLGRAVEMVDNLILLYRENILKQFVSYQTAMQTREWYESLSRPSDLGRVKTPIYGLSKITWNLNQYLEFHEDILKWTRDYKKNLSNFNHKKTVIIKYEDISELTSYKKNITKVLESNGIDCTVGNCQSKKQSIESIDVADRFTNKEEFLDDYNKIQDKMLLVMEDA
jgi:hypothetical protein